MLLSCLLLAESGKCAVVPLVQSPGLLHGHRVLLDIEPLEDDVECVVSTGKHRGESGIKFVSSFEQNIPALFGLGQAYNE